MSKLNKIDSLTKEKFKEIIENSTTFKEVFWKVGISNTLKYYTKLLKARLEREGVSIQHFTGKSSHKMNVGLRSAVSLRKKLFIHDRLYACEMCGIKDTWIRITNFVKKEHLLYLVNGFLGDKITTGEFLEKIDKIKNYKEEAIYEKKYKKSYKSCLCNICNKETGIGSKTKRCQDCWDKMKPRKITCSVNEMKYLIWSKPSTHIAKDFGCSENAILKFCSKNHLKVPGRGYWAKVHFGIEKIKNKEEVDILY